MHTDTKVSGAVTEPARLRRDAAANRDRLIAAAIEVFNDEGIDAGVDRIAERAGVGVGTLYRRFPTKDQLIRYLVQEMLEEMIQAAVAARKVPDGRGLEQFLRSVAHQFAAHRGCLRRLWSQEPSSAANVQRFRRQVDHLVRDARNAGTVRADVTRADVTTLLWSLNGIIENADDQALAQGLRLLDIVFAGLRPA